MSHCDDRLVDNWSQIEESKELPKDDSENQDVYKTPVKRPPTVDSCKENVNPFVSYSATISARVTSIFEENVQANDLESFCDELSQTGNFLNEDKEPDLLMDDFKKKKM